VNEQIIASPRAAFVPHDLTAPLTGKPQGPLFGLQAAVKDMYDIAGSRTGGADEHLDRRDRDDLAVEASQHLGRVGGAVPRKRAAERSRGFRIAAEGGRRE